MKFLALLLIFALSSCNGMKWKTSKNTKPTRKISLLKRDISSNKGTSTATTKIISGVECYLSVERNGKIIRRKKFREPLGTEFHFSSKVESGEFYAMIDHNQEHSRIAISSKAEDLSWSFIHNGKKASTIKVADCRKIKRNKLGAVIRCFPSGQGSTKITKKISFDCERNNNDDSVYTKHIDSFYATGENSQVRRALEMLSKVPISLSFRGRGSSKIYKVDNHNLVLLRYYKTPYPEKTWQKEGNYASGIYEVTGGKFCDENSGLFCTPSYGVPISICVARKSGVLVPNDVESGRTKKTVADSLVNYWWYNMVSNLKSGLKKVFNYNKTASSKQPKLGTLRLLRYSKNLDDALKSSYDNDTRLLPEKNTPHALSGNYYTKYAGVSVGVPKCRNGVSVLMEHSQVEKLEVVFDRRYDYNKNRNKKK
ncbi:MAG: hypothetical protein HAW60_01100 [Bdellovibrionales bacterium]|nr:hypothetical protein [Bdellovibrionales bacterium]